MEFWNQPTSCTDTTYENGFKVEYKKQLVCAPTSLVKIATAPSGGGCSVDTGNAVSEPQSYCGYTEVIHVLPMTG